MADNALGQSLGGHFDRGVETVTAKDQGPAKEVLALAKSNTIVLCGVAVLSGVLAQRQNDHSEITFFGANRKPINVPGRPDTLEVPVADGDTVFRIAS